MEDGQEYTRKYKLEKQVLSWQSDFMQKDIVFVCTQEILVVLFLEPRGQFSKRF